MVSLHLNDAWQHIKLDSYDLEYRERERVGERDGKVMEMDVHILYKHNIYIYYIICGISSLF